MIVLTLAGLLAVAALIGAGVLFARLREAESADQAARRTPPRTGRPAPTAGPRAPGATAPTTLLSAVTRRHVGPATFTRVQGTCAVDGGRTFTEELTVDHRGDFVTITRANGQTFAGQLGSDEDIYWMNDGATLRFEATLSTSRLSGNFYEERPDCWAAWDIDMVLT